MERILCYPVEGHILQLTAASVTDVANKQMVNSRACIGQYSLVSRSLSSRTFLVSKQANSIRDLQAGVAHLRAAHTDISCFTTFELPSRCLFSSGRRSQRIQTKNGVQSIMCRIYCDLVSDSESSLRTRPQKRPIVDRLSLYSLPQHSEIRVHSPLLSCRADLHVVPVKATRSAKGRWLFSQPVRRATSPSCPPTISRSKPLSALQKKNYPTASRILGPGRNMATLLGAKPRQLWPARARRERGHEKHHNRFVVGWRRRLRRESRRTNTYSVGRDFAAGSRTRTRSTTDFPLRSQDVLLTLLGAAVAERLARSPPTKANWVQSPGRSPDFRKWESCRTMPLVGGSSRRSPASPAPSLRGRSIFTSITLIGLQDLVVKSLPKPLHSLATLHYCIKF
ncbi:hypothetical protein PR048_016680 [Dryococelus australis]|uniref:Uncharacterized protein n=1 Tax=Dryococelus australis TaxID=614101 RepID=A0ABQ9H7H1_9NEOP|nr:hypothetical protein PR048_016680 [Dryococelus australis]